MTGFEMKSLTTLMKIIFIFIILINGFYIDKEMDTDLL